MSAIVSGVVAGIALHRELEGAMEGISEAFVTYESGIEGDIRGSGGHNRKRQVTVLFGKIGFRRAVKLVRIFTGLRAEQMCSSHRSPLSLRDHG